MASPKKGSKSRVNKVEWLERVIAIQRVTKVVKGGKKMSFRAIVVVGDEMGKVGVGVGSCVQNFILIYFPFTAGGGILFITGNIILFKTEVIIFCDLFLKT